MIVFLVPMKPFLLKLQRYILTRTFETEIKELEWPKNWFSLKSLSFKWSTAKYLV